MNKTLTVTIDENVYNGLIESVAPQDMNQFVEDILRPYVTQPDLESAYQEMSVDSQRESEATLWVEATVQDVAHEEG